MSTKLLRPKILLLILLFVGTTALATIYRPYHDSTVSAAGLKSVPGNSFGTGGQGVITSASFEFVSAAYILGHFTVAGVEYTYLFYDPNPLDSQPQYRIVGYDSNNGDHGKIVLDQVIKPADGSNDSAPKSAKIDMDYKVAEAAGWTSTNPKSSNISITDNGYSRALYYFSDPKNIKPFVQRPYGTAVNLTLASYTQGGATAPNIFVSNSEGSGVPCRDILIVTGTTNGSQVRAYDLTETGSSGTRYNPHAPAETLNTGCYVSTVNLLGLSEQDHTPTPDFSVFTAASAKIVTLDDPLQALIQGSASGGGLGGLNTGGGNTAVARNSCTNVNEQEGIGLRWILCPIIEILDSGINWLDTNIQSQLITPDITTFSASSQLHEAWGRIRNIALLLLIPIMLFMVIGTALQFSFLDPYTVRKAMPRFLIAIIFISVSWYLTAFMINFTNTIGTGILGIMTQPFGGANVHLADLVTAGGGVATSLGSLAIFGGAVLSGSITLGVVASFAFGAALALLLGLFLLTIRQLIIYACVLLAPLAILSWVFPSNDKLWKVWWDIFSRLLIMFPIIMILMAAGKIFAFIIQSLPG